MIIDCAVHPVCPSSELARRLDEPYRGLAVPEPQNQRYVPPRGWMAPGLSEAVDAARQEADSFVFAESGAEAAILVPGGRGLIASATHAAAVASAHNRWLKECWLDPDQSGRYRGSIRVSTSDPEAAVAEIERWADDPRFVQVAVPMAAHAPYGRAPYFPIWRAASRLGLPVAVLADGQMAMEFAPTPVGYPSHFTEVATLQPMLAAMHITSLIAEGVFDRLPDLRFVFVDGGFDLVRPVLWRLRKDWRATRFELAAKEDPLAYIPRHVRFVTGFADGPSDSQQLAAVAGIEGADQLLMYGSHHPRWDRQGAADVFAACPDPLRRSILMTNAENLYGARLQAGAG
ncbi:MAG TPA: amidohydrolase family protein [Candidatus Nitrosotalea sp.]|nr:amidohydrolase family protein [Candidatus Nitrosotalea sp.]